jgi:hypothetical protein
MILGDKPLLFKGGSVTVSRLNEGGVSPPPHGGHASPRPTQLACLRERKREKGSSKERVSRERERKDTVVVEGA